LRPDGDREGRGDRRQLQLEPEAAAHVGMTFDLDVGFFTRRSVNESAALERRFLF
jgi:hypothetical protein